MVSGTGLPKLLESWIREVLEALLFFIASPVTTPVFWLGGGCLDNFRIAAGHTKDQTCLVGGKFQLYPLTIWGGVGDWVIKTMELRV